MFLPGQDDIEALQSLLEDNLPGIVGQQYQDIETLGGDLESKKSICQSESKSDGDEPSVERKGSASGHSIIVKKGILVDFEIRPLYAAMPPEEQVTLSFHFYGYFNFCCHLKVYFHFYFYFYFSFSFRDIEVLSCM